MLHVRTAIGLVAAACMLAACSEARPFGVDGNGGDGARTDANVNNGDGSLSGDGGDAGNTTQDVPPIPIDGGGDGCSDAARLVYVLSDANDLYSFRPDRREFTLIGRLNCPTAFSPNSMAIDRSAVAWVNYVQSDGFSDSAGLVFRVSTADAHCTSDPPFSLPDGWFRLGMGFSTDSVEGADETLYVTGTGGVFSSSPGLGSIDRMTTILTPIGQFSGSLRGQSAELTGTGDGRLFGFFTTTPVQVARIDKVTGATSMSQSFSQVETPAAWAFSFWGGDFYLYTAPDPLTDPSRTSNVTRYRPSDGSVDAAYMENVGFRIVGAGVSTCAPILPPG